MRLHEELFRGVDALTSARYTVTVNGGGYFQGVKAVGDFSSESIVLYFPHGCVEVQGEALSIAKYLDGDLEIRGKIFAVLTQAQNKTENGQ